jgi:hypothetical protein
MLWGLWRFGFTRIRGDLTSGARSAENRVVFAVSYFGFTDTGANARQTPPTFSDFVSPGPGRDNRSPAGPANGRISSLPLEREPSRFAARRQTKTSHTAISRPTASWPLRTGTVRAPFPSVAQWLWPYRKDAAPANAGAVPGWPWLAGCGIFPASPTWPESSRRRTAGNLKPQRWCASPSGSRERLRNYCRACLRKEMGNGLVA